MRQYIVILFVLFFITSTYSLNAQVNEKSLEQLGKVVVTALEKKDVSLIEPYFITENDIQYLLDVIEEKLGIEERKKAEEEFKGAGEIERFLEVLNQKFLSSFQEVIEDLETTANRDVLLDNVYLDTQFQQDTNFRRMDMETASLYLENEAFLIELESIYLNDNRGWVFTIFDYN